MTDDFNQKCQKIIERQIQTKNSTKLTMLSNKLNYLTPKSPLLSQNMGQKFY